MAQDPLNIVFTLHFQNANVLFDILYNYCICLLNPLVAPGICIWCFIRQGDMNWCLNTSC